MVVTIRAGAEWKKRFDFADAPQFADEFLTWFGSLPDEGSEALLQDRLTNELFDLSIRVLDQVNGPANEHGASRWSEGRLMVILKRLEDSARRPSGP